METPESPINTADASIKLALVLAMGDKDKAVALAKQWLFSADGNTPATVTLAAMILFESLVATLLEKLTVTPNDPLTS
jgi:hypothetical protein